VEELKAWCWTAKICADWLSNLLIHRRRSRGYVKMVIYGNFLYPPPRHNVWGLSERSWGLTRYARVKPLHVSCGILNLHWLGFEFPPSYCTLGLSIMLACRLVLETLGIEEELLWGCYIVVGARTLVPGCVEDLCRTMSGSVLNDNCSKDVTKVCSLCRDML